LVEGSETAVEFLGADAGYPPAPEAAILNRGALDKVAQRVQEGIRQLEEYHQAYLEHVRKSREQTT
jgi:hypothetical protein